ncbi:DUF6359 domain-containing protein [Chungangia koreensis]|uniref:DUF6359 domain-containing protein n=1 Tax=Chungangia koreensis TaxID=752657 RepID=A0ABV8X5F9_9LACT
MHKKAKVVKQRFVTLLAAMVLVLSAAIPVSVKAEDVLTVAEAIANNSGNGTVEGYIVGNVTGINSVDTEPPFGGDTNFAIADSPNETNTDNMLYVQLTTDFRPEFGLKTNPDNIGKKARVTGSLEAYFTHAGLKNPTVMTWADGSGGGEEEPPFEPIDPITVREIGIHEIQGEGHVSPYEGQVVSGVVGVVTSVIDSRNLYIQDLFPDDNENTSEGLLVYKVNHGAKVGDVVLVEGQVKEWVLDGYSEKLETDLAMTEVNAVSVEKINTAELPEPVLIGEGGLIPPTEVIDNDNFAEFDPEEDGIDFYESLEGMLVTLESPQVVAPQKYGEVFVVPNGTDTFFNNGGGVNIFEDDYNPERLTIETSNNFIAKAGDRFNGAVTGVVSYGFSNFKVLTGGQVPSIFEGDTAPETTWIEKDPEKLTVAAYNMENFSPETSQDKVARIAESIVNELKAPDILSLVEVQDNNGPTDDGTTDASASYQLLVDAIVAAGGPEYAFTDIAPADKEDGGQPGGNIRVGFIYNPDRVQLAEGEKGGTNEAVAWEDGSLTLNPGRIAPESFPDTRKSLAAEFVFNGEKVVVIANHLNSKGGDQPLFGKNQPPYLASEAERVELARMINSFISEGMEQNENLNVIVAGDMNDFEFSAPLQALKGSILTNMVEEVPLEDRYSYTYQGNSQVLDHILVSNNLADRTEVDMVHINSVFMEEHGRASDHDPVLIQTSLEKPADGVIEEGEWEVEEGDDEIRLVLPEEEILEETSVVLVDALLNEWAQTGKRVVIDFGLFEATFNGKQLQKLVNVEGDSVTVVYDSNADYSYKGKGQSMVAPFSVGFFDEDGEAANIKWNEPLTFMWDFGNDVVHKHVKTFYLDGKGKWKNAPVTNKGSLWTFKVKDTDAITIVKTK